MQVALARCIAIVTCAGILMLWASGMVLAQSPVHTNSGKFVRIQIASESSTAHLEYRLLIQGLAAKATTLVLPKTATSTDQLFVAAADIIFLQLEAIGAIEREKVEFHSVSHSRDPTDGTIDVLRANGVSVVVQQAVPLRHFSVAIRTRDRFGAGTDNQVYFDAGFKAWPLNSPQKDDFERGSHDRYELPLPRHVQLTWDDIIYARLEKKGLAHFTGMWDGFGGPWEPESIQLYVNGHPFGPAIEIPDGIILKADSPAWMQMLRPLNELERIAWALRVENHEPGSRADEVLALVTTPIGKKNGISGWQPGPLPTDVPQRATAIGIIRNPPSPGLDGYVSLDLEVEQLSNSRHHIDFKTASGVPQARYLRIEYLHGPNSWPGIDSRVEVTGDVKWDTDREGFYEIHPLGPKEIRVISQSK